jgi:predicted N-acetyltransferase YhbS
MPVTIRPLTPSDAAACGQIAFAAHQAVAAAHNFPPEQPSVEFATGMMHALLHDPVSSGLAAEQDGEIVGSVFFHRLAPELAVIGPLTVEPPAQGGPGRCLLDAALAQVRAAGVQGVRLVQSPFHLRSLALYAKLGFQVREPLLLLHGELPRAEIPGRTVRPATAGDLPTCHRLAHQVHGFAREVELQRGLDRQTAQVVERDGAIVGYQSGLGFLDHAVALTTEDLQALISAAPAIGSPGFFVPTRQAELLRWLLDAGLQAQWPATLMTQGWYQEPQGAYLPAISM